jgi:hypothetical protein
VSGERRRVSRRGNRGIRGADSVDIESAALDRYLSGLTQAQLDALQNF